MQQAYKMKKTITIALILSFMAFLVVPHSAFADQDGSAVGIFAEHVNTYNNWNQNNTKQLGDLNTTDELVSGLINTIVNDPNTNWGYKWYANSDVEEADWNSYDSSFADDYDLSVYTGHGYPSNKFALDTNYQSWNLNGTYSGINWGDRDVEWVLTFTCRFLEGSTPDVYGFVANGVHAVTGYKTDMTITADSGTVFANYIKSGYSVRRAWELYGDDTQSLFAGNYTRVFGAIASDSDKLWGYGSVSADPIPYGNDKTKYSYWDHAA